MLETKIASAADVERLAATLTDAFADDPLSRWMTPAHGYPGRLTHLFRFLLSDGVSRAVVDTLAGGPDIALAGAAIWTRPGQWKVPGTTLVRNAGLIARASGMRLPRLIGRLTQLEHLHPTEPAHWYLQVLGVACDHRGRGLGSALLSSRLAQLDEQQVPAYLESSNPRNLSLYQRHGFTITKEVAFRHGPPQWLMWREPRPRQARTDA